MNQQVLDEKAFKRKNFTLRGRIFHPNLFEPKGSRLSPDKPKYSVLFAWEMGSQAQQTQEVINLLTLARQTFLGTIPEAVVKMPVKTWGQSLRTDGKPQAQYLKDCYWMNCNANPTFKPAVVDSTNQPIIDPSMVYSGVNALVNFSFWVFNQGSHGISANLNAVRIEQGGDKEVGGGVSAEEAFSSFMGETMQQPGQAAPNAFAAPVAQPVYAAPVAQPIAQQAYDALGNPIIPTNSLV